MYLRMVLALFLTLTSMLHIFQPVQLVARSSVTLEARKNQWLPSGCIEFFSTFGGQSQAVAASIDRSEVEHSTPSTSGLPRLISSHKSLCRKQPFSKQSLLKIAT